MPGAEADLQDRADALATVIGRGFEPDPIPDHTTVATAAPIVADLHEQRLAELARVLPGEGE